MSKSTFVQALSESFQKGIEAYKAPNGNDFLKAALHLGAVFLIVTVILVVFGVIQEFFLSSSSFYRQRILFLTIENIRLPGNLYSALFVYFTGMLIVAHSNVKFSDFSVSRLFQTNNKNFVNTLLFGSAIIWLVHILIGIIGIFLIGINGKFDFLIDYFYELLNFSLILVPYGILAWSCSALQQKVSLFNIKSQRETFRIRFLVITFSWIIITFVNHLIDALGVNLLSHVFPRLLSVILQGAAMCVAAAVMIPFLKSSILEIDYQESMSSEFESSDDELLDDII